MKICYFTNNLYGRDGWSRYSLDLALNIQKQGHEVLCLVNKLEKKVKLEQKDLLSSPLRYLANPFLAWQTSRRVKEAIQKFNPDIIHFIVEPYAAILPFLKIKPPKTVITIHGTYSYIPNLFNLNLKKILAKFLSHKFYRQIDQIISVSHYTKNHLNKFIDVKNKTAVIGNGVNLKNFPLTSENREIKNKIKQIIFVGGIKPAKGIYESLQALKIYHDQFSPDFCFTIIGKYQNSDTYYNKLKAYIETNNLESRVKFTGPIRDSELLSYYQSADLFLMPSLAKSDRWIEGYGLVYLEAASQAVPVIGSRQSGAAEAVGDGYNGLLVDPHNPVDVAGKINQILNQNVIKRANCLAWAREHDIEKVSQKIINLYQSLT